MADGTRDCYLAADGDELQGLAAVLPLHGCPAVFLEYLAVAPAARNAGIGARILGYLRELTGTARPGTEGVIFEVDRPEDATDSAERDLRERRIGFYQRNGAAVLEAGRNYRAPASEGGGTLAYLLMWLPVAPGALPPAGARLKAYVTAMFTQSYELSEDTALVHELVARVG
jgi:ribosomal protein S18 acetylase RimI-like enzyme